MSYNYEIEPSCKKTINKLCKKNPLLKKILDRKMDEIIQNPSHYKPLKYGLSGEKRVHIMKSFVLKFSVNENTRLVTFLTFGHHDQAY